MSTETVEWGSEHSPTGVRRSRLPARQVARLVTALAGVGFLLLVVAQTLPWLTMIPRLADDPESQRRTTLTMGLGELFNWQSMSFYLGAVVLLTLTGVVLLAHPAVRRSAGAAALGCAAGLAVVLTGLFNTLKYSGTLAGAGGLGDEAGFQRTVSPGFYCAVAGLLLVVAAIVLAGLWAGRTPLLPLWRDEPTDARDRPETVAPPAYPTQPQTQPEPFVSAPVTNAGEPRPIDITVAPAPPFDSR